MPEVVDNKWTICFQTVEVRSEKQNKNLNYYYFFHIVSPRADLKIINS
jgi:hypothetical protein